MSSDSWPQIKNRLGPLEGAVLDVLRRKPEAPAKIVFVQVRKKRKTALTSVCVMLDRLYQKGLVDRRMESCRGGFRYIYRAKKTKEDYERAILDDTVKRLVQRFGHTAVAYFNEKFGKGRE